MGKGIYTYYKERLIEIGGNNKCLYLKNVVRKGAYDLGRIFEGRDNKVADFIEFLWSGGKYSLPLINTTEKYDILRNLDIAKRSSLTDAYESPYNLTKEDIKKSEKAVEDEHKRLLDLEITKIKELKRETDEIEKETGRFELFVGYPFVFGCITNGASKTMVKAPLLLFPVKIEIIGENSAEISLNRAERIHINQALIFAYAQAKKLNIEQLELEFDDIADNFKNVRGVINYLADANIKIDCNPSKNVYAYNKFKEPDAKTELSIRYAAVMARFPLSNSIYQDYTLLEKKNLSNEAINELLRTDKKKDKKLQFIDWFKKKSANEVECHNNSYVVKMLDYAQSEVVKKVDECGNVVIYGPPGTGKSQTIVNIITDAVSKHKRVLVVSQKKAALDVVYNRLGLLNQKSMYITDEGKQKQHFYENCMLAHQRSLANAKIDLEPLKKEFDELQARIDEEESKLLKIEKMLNTPLEFGISASNMYTASYNLSKGSSEYTIYGKMVLENDIMSLNYTELRDALFNIQSHDLATIYYEFMEKKDKNPLIDNLVEDVDIHTLSEVSGELEYIQKSRKALFDTAKYPYYKQILAHFNAMKSEKALNEIVKFELKQQKVNILFKGKAEENLRAEFNATVEAIREYIKDYDCLHKVLTEDGYIAVIDNVLRGNTPYVKLVFEAIDNYIAYRDITKLLNSLGKAERAVLNFAYDICRNFPNYKEILEKLMEIRIYHEVLEFEKKNQDDLSLITDFNNITSKIYKLKQAQLDVSYRICDGTNHKEYSEYYEEAKNNKDYLYQISKNQKFWPIRKTMEVYSDFILGLFPCWLLSPENVSSILPLEKNLFDVVIFDEASQVFIESTIPTIYRGKSIVVAGDEKQLRPSATFMKRYLGADPENQDDYSIQAALEVDSLLDLAVARYESANLTYHYRSKNQELIDFSNCAFYNTGLQIAPNISQNLKNRPIERHLVKGKWVDRKNVAEAKEIVDILKDIFANRKNNESIGIITFNSDQQACINDMIDKECAKTASFRSNILKETHRVENGEDTSLFVKNLENVQGDERDIIIFSIGYAENESGKVYTSFGSLSSEGGENRLNVAITRAKSKIIVVTSIEPEELKVEGSKNLGPKLLRSYLAYVRAVANGNTEEVNTILSELSTLENKNDGFVTNITSIEDQIKEKLEKQGYTVVTQLGNGNNKISLAVYDKKLDKYLVGVELDKDSFKSSASCMERDVYKPRFLEARGWTILRVWCRDWWLSPAKVIRSIVTLAEKNREG